MRWSLRSCACVLLPLQKRRRSSKEEGAAAAAAAANIGGGQQWTRGELKALEDALLLHGQGDIAALRKAVCLFASSELESFAVFRRSARPCLPVRDGVP